VYILTNRLVGMRGEALPLPWYQRAPLGLLSGAPVYVALQASERRPFGDLLVSAVDPINWPFVSEIRASREDEPGVLAEAYKGAPPLNIVFAEAVTLDSGLRHDVRLVVEPYDDRSRAGTAVRRRVGKLKRHLEDRGFSKPVATGLHERLQELAWIDVGRVDQGWVRVAGWRDALEVQRDSSPVADEYDLDMAVVFADTHSRMLRYVFPRRGAVSISVDHADRPGAMSAIAEALAGEDLNVLSSLLRRGSAPRGKAQVVLVVEPTGRATDAGDVDRRVREALADLPVELMISVKVQGAVDPEDAVLYPRRPHEIAVQPSKPMVAMIAAVKDALPRGKRPIFISRRFVDESDPSNEEILRKLGEILDEHGFVAVEAIPQPGTDITASDEVKAKMWASDAAILLVISTQDERELSENLAHECGFMQGQGKRLLPLVEDGAAHRMSCHANLQGLQRAGFTKEAACGDGPGSIYQAVRPWLALLEKEGRRAA